MSRTVSLLGRFFERFERRDEREFLPAALEILETPPSPTGRATAMTIGLFFILALGWAFLGKVDVLATAPGRVLPAGKIKVVQPLDAGVVRAIHVQDGDHVRAGQLLIELDPTATGADRERLTRDLVQAELDVAKLSALKHGAGAFVPPADATPAQIEETRANLRALADGQAAKLANLDQQISEKRSMAAEIAAEIAKLRASLPMLTEKDRLHRQLREKGYGTSFAALDAQQQLSDARRDLDVQAQRAAQAEASRTALERQRDETVSQFAAGVLGDLAKAEQQRSQVEQELIKAQRKSTDTELRAPTDGVVEELAVHTVGGVVTPAQRLLVVVPEGGGLTVEALLPNRDVGFVHPGQPAEVKIETFNFTRYGLIHGRVADVSRNAVPERAVQEGSGEPPQAGSPTYVARISLERPDMLIDGVRRPLRPDMAVTVEIKTGRRTIIDYLLSPLARRADESLHER